MPAPRKYPEELKERATRLAVDARRDAATRRGAIARIAGQLDIHPEALRGWVRWAEAASSTGSSSSRSRLVKEDGVVEEVSDRQRILELEAKNRELTRANLLLRQAVLNSTGQRNTIHDSGGGVAWRRSGGRGCLRTGGSRCGSGGRPATR